MRCWPVYVLVISTAHLAVADEPVEEWTPPPYAAETYELEVSRSVLAALTPRTGWSAGLFASMAGTADRDGRTGTAAGGGQLATPGLSDACRYLRARGAVYVAETAAEDDRRYSADVTTTACVFRGVVRNVAAPGLTVEHHLAYDVRPALSARRTLLRSHYTAQNWRIDGSAFEGRDDKLPYGSALFAYTLAIDTVAQGTVRETSYSLDVRTVVLGPTDNLIAGAPSHPDAIIHIPADELSILGLFVRSAPMPGTDRMVGGLNFGSLKGLRVGRGVVMDFAFGIAMGSLPQPADPAMVSPDGATGIFTPRGSVAAAQARDDLAWSASYQRDSFPTVDGALAIEDRLTGAVELRRWLPGVQLSGFAAHTQLYSPDDIYGDWTAGATVARTWALGDHVNLAVSGEAARSYYARLDGATPRPEPAARVLAVVSGHLGTR